MLGIFCIGFGCIGFGCIGLWMGYPLAFWRYCCIGLDLDETSVKLTSS